MYPSNTYLVKFDKEAPYPQTISTEINPSGGVYFTVWSGAYYTELFRYDGDLPVIMREGYRGGNSVHITARTDDANKYYVDITHDYPIQETVVINKWSLNAEPSSTP